MKVVEYMTLLLQFLLFLVILGLPIYVVYRIFSFIFGDSKSLSSFFLLVFLILIVYLIYGR